MTFPKILIKLRTRAELTQKELAKLVDISRSALSLYELGKREPDFETLKKLAEYFNVSTDYLLGRTPNPQQFYINDTSEYLSEEEREFVIKNKPLIMTTKDAVNKTSPEKIKQLLKLVIDLDKENP